MGEQIFKDDVEDGKVEKEKQNHASVDENIIGRIVVSEKIVVPDENVEKGERICQ